MVNRPQIRSEQLQYVLPRRKKRCTRQQWQAHNEGNRVHGDQVRFGIESERGTVSSEKVNLVDLNMYINKFWSFKNGKTKDRLKK